MVEGVHDLVDGYQEDCARPCATPTCTASIPAAMEAQTRASSYRLALALDNSGCSEFDREELDGACRPVALASREPTRLLKVFSAEAEELAALGRGRRPRRSRELVQQSPRHANGRWAAGIALAESYKPAETQTCNSGAPPGDRQMQLELNRLDEQLLEEGNPGDNY